MSDYDAVVIGAGNGGLTAALTLAKKGKSVLLLERHNIPGGCATSFIRGRFEFEVALHQLSSLGSPENPGPLRMMLDNLGIMEMLEIVTTDTMYNIVMPGRIDLALPSDRVASQEVLKARFPREKEAIDKYFDLVFELCMQWVNIDVLKDPEASREKYPLFYHYRFKDASSVLDEFFTDPELKLVVGIYWMYLGMPPSRLAFFDLALVFFILLVYDPAHIKGGSQALSNAIIEKYLEHGGTVRFNCGVEKIVISNNKVAGVITDDGSEITCDAVISNASPITTYFDMIDPEYVPPEELRILGTRTIGTSAFTVYMGLDCEPEEVGIRYGANFLCTSTDMEHHFDLMKTMQPPGAALFECYDVVDRDFSPPGACQIAYVAMQYADPWYDIPPQRYADAKYAYAQGMLDLAEKAFPGCRDHIEEIELASPFTHLRYLGHPGGAIYGAEQSPKDCNLMIDPISRIKGLSFVGAWSTTGGFHPTLASGVTVARTIPDLKGVMS